MTRGACTLEGEAVPKMFEVRPPGGASTREVGRSVSTLPAFWFEPDANAFALVPFFATGAAELELGTGSWLTRGACTLAGEAVPKISDVWPPGGACSLVVDLSEMTLPILMFERDSQNNNKDVGDLMTHPLRKKKPNHPNAKERKEKKRKRNSPAFWLLPFANLLLDTACCDPASLPHPRLQLLLL